MAGRAGREWEPSPKSIVLSAIFAFQLHSSIRMPQRWLEDKLSLRGAGALRAGLEIGC
jgi:hypothetical protein